MKSFNEFLDYLKIDVVQLAVLIFGVTEVFLARANNVLLYPAGIAATTLSIYSLFGVKLYAECLLHVYYLVMSVYGWLYWNSAHGGAKVRITFASRTDWTITAAIVGGASIVLYFFLVSFTTSEVPVWDAWISATGWAGMWLLARRKAENWILLNISNAFAIPLLFMKGLTLFAVLTVILFIVACKGYLDWSATAKQAKTHEI